jgi:NAD(P)-dependent dehydrogenase (short-subunit alcohol dehydrogenase family)
MDGSARRRVAVITGASSGIGKETARTLATQGWQVFAIGRDPERSAAAEAELRAAAPDADVTMIRADLALMAEAERAAAEIAAHTDHIDVLVNNAGGMATDMIVTPEGYEANFAGNHLGPFLLTNRLLPLIRAAAADAPPGAVRIVNTSSDASEMIPGFDWDDLQLFDHFSSGRAYCQAKLANVMFARGLATRLAADGVVVHAVHPGTIASNFASHAPESTQAYMRTLDSMTPAQGAEALVWLATGDEPGRSTGGYYHQHKPTPPNPLADNGAAVERLWDESAVLLARREIAI